MDKGKVLQLDHSWLKFYIGYTIEEMKKLIEYYESKGIDDELMTKLRCIDSVYQTTMALDSVLEAHGRN